MGNEEPSGQQAVEPALVCGCGWEGSYADLNETAEGMTCPKCRLGRNLDCAAALATPPAPSASFRDRLEELAQDWSSRKYNYPSDRVSDEEYARNEGKEDAYQDAAIDLCRLLKEPETSPPWQEGDAVQWACERWRAEVANRPLVNTHRRALDTTWRQVVRHFGGDDVALLGPCHDDLVSAQEGTGNDG